jgi:hypothetical protein
MFADIACGLNCARAHAFLVLAIVLDWIVDAREVPGIDMPRFVILEHDHPSLHWDLMLQAGDVLQTWRLAHAPKQGVIIEATALGDHRLAYLDYEGPVSGGRGVVKRWDCGEFTEDAESTVSARRLEFTGTRVGGCVLLEQLDGANWRFSLSSPAPP